MYSFCIKIIVFIITPLSLIITPLSLCFAQEQIELNSPDGNISFSFELTQKTPIYNIRFKGQKIIENSELNLSFNSQGGFGEDLIIKNTEFNEIKDSYDLIVGKASKVFSHYNEVKISLQETDGVEREINLVVRIFNDGVAFRYEFPPQENWKSFEIIDENSSFNLHGNPVAYTLFREHYNTSHEGIYSVLPYEEIKNDTLMDMPALFEFPDSTYVAITEANLRDYAGMYLIKHNGILTSQLSPRQGQNKIKVVGQLPHRSPWRVLMIGDRIGTLLESNIITNLNEPTRIEDTSWIRPGKTTFHWWNGDILPDSTIVPGVNFETNKYYIDFAARHHIEYHAVIGYGGFAWYKSDAPHYGVVGPNTDVTTTVPSLDMQQIYTYASKKGVGISVWVNWKAIYPDLEKAFSQFEKWGIKGMMVDFMDRDDQEMVMIQEEILKKAAEHKLFVQFHGSFKPTGLHRTYPNELTREGSYNYEQNKWSSNPVPPLHDLNIIFTRMLAGATDYHLGGFRAVPEEDFKTQYTRPLMAGTRCHIMAMYIVLESYLSMVADYPEAYEGQAGFEFIKNVPTVWDEMSVPAAALGEFVTIARRKGENWYVGSINNNKSRQINVPLNFLSEGKYLATIYTDAADVSRDPNKISKYEQVVNKNEILTLNLAENGGLAMKLEKLK